MMSLTTSTGMVEEVCSTGTVPPGFRRSSRPAGLAVDVVLADQRLRPDLAARVRAEVLEARLRDLDGDHGLGRLALLLDHLEVGRLAGVHAAHPEVAALGQAEGVVEHDPVGPALGALVRRSGDHEGAGADAGHREHHQEAPHLGVPLSLSSQSSRSRSSCESDVRAVPRGRLGGARAALVLLVRERVLVEDLGHRDEAARRRARGRRSRRPWSRSRRTSRGSRSCTGARRRSRRRRPSARRRTPGRRPCVSPTEWRVPPGA